ncbi:6,7-dimethyl-8-ribityllumazine synthase [Neomicrococcus aestuarii]|uniref:6,7-dimethyl-8-ribityllumazine synthase n=1 Tax=Neomicrococcus aestuarii TaxID=556325 RepID=A0A1L2ZKS6_9MICC|nr:6,7-dimethyl-8-ribityllumazine synthase [Neomicrococcus aestuarii]APF39810.1 6,7-dimethyl-8-ribityllumazine synthase [Neomicrococcus aestuarii]MBB5513845.1 6,7-dimethyl-8-ribityllumazine synthase [Neomicrococcus aestuarii]
MSGHGAPEANLQNLTAAGEKGLTVAIIASSWHTQVMNGLIDGAQRAAADAGVTAELIRVPGSFELPVAAARLAPRFDAVVALGVVIRGGTPHFDFVCAGATNGLMDVAVTTGKPVGFGLLTCDTEEQAIDRAGLPGSAEDKGYEAMAAALETAVVLA